jgi:hypothetical protein
VEERSGIDIFIGVVDAIDAGWFAIFLLATAGVAVASGGTAGWLVAAGLLAVAAWRIHASWRDWRPNPRRPPTSARNGRD